MRVLALLVAGVLPLLPGCARLPEGPTVPASSLHPAAHSALMGEADELIAALGSGDVRPVAARMTARLHEQLPPAALRSAAHQLRASFGEPRGIIEEHLQREGALVWYSGLVLYGRRGPGGRERVTPVLYQVAFTPTRQIERLLVREHWFLEHLEAPAEHYLPITRLHVPAEGAWTVAQGGPTRELNAHHGSQSQRFAYDLVLVIDGRFRRPGVDPTTNEAYYGYGQPLRAPAAGEVVRVVEGIADNVPGERGKGGGNGVIIDHGFGEVSYLWHVRPGTLRVQAGDHVEPGQIVAEVGNTGRSTGAHIHMHLTRGADELALPAPLVDVVVDGIPRDLAAPVRGQRVEARLRMPARALARGPRVLLDA
ncbi:MAG: M23 family metallopeptidase [Myxococcales bacterium]|nr:M23 family metallopeptidase [Myxococcales bacterium]